MKLAKTVVYLAAVAPTVVVVVVVVYSLLFRVVFIVENGIVERHEAGGTRLKLEIVHVDVPSRVVHEHVEFPRLVVVDHQWLCV